MTSSKNYLLWDFDGTLAYRPGQWTDTVMLVLRRAGLATGIDREAVRPFMNTGFPWHEPDVIRPAGQAPDEWWRRLEPVLARAFECGAQVGSERAKELARLVRAAYLDTTAWIVFEDVVPGLTRLSRLGWRHVILSNHVPELPTLIENLDLHGHFEAIHTSGLTGVEKPNPQAFRRVLDTLPKGAAVWMLGDSLDADVRGAEAVGLPAILVRKASDASARQCADLGGVIDLLSGASPESRSRPN
ncbi:MAG TPA: HAD-IA family hydrolase [Candidatus Sulfotelmatobacter sp.]|nr:HAD-IA family hydrolase [Candidatus Sulfotelmatobacter sp.]